MNIDKHSLKKINTRQDKQPHGDKSKTKTKTKSKTKTKTRPKPRPRPRPRPNKTISTRQDKTNKQDKTTHNKTPRAREEREERRRQEDKTKDKELCLYFQSLITTENKEPTIAAIMALSNNERGPASFHSARGVFVVHCVCHRLALVLTDANVLRK